MSNNIENEINETVKIDKYRFETGSLYIYDEDSAAYVCCFTSFKKITKNSAIAAYERFKED